MATKVQPTPTISGEDAERFIQRLNEHSIEEEIKAFKRAKMTFEKIKFENRKNEDKSGSVLFVTDV